MRHAQPRTGFRSGIEPVLLAAAVPARPGQRVFEGGSGCGAALLCLAARVPGIAGAGIEIVPELAAIAAANAAANGFGGLSFSAGDVTAPEAGAGPFDHALANPPYHGAGTPSPLEARERAKRASATTAEDWVAALARRLAPRGTLTLAIAASALEAFLAALRASGCGSIALHPLWPHAGEAAKLVIVQAVRGGRGGSRILAGTALHAADGAFTPEAAAVLRDGAALAF